MSEANYTALITMIGTTLGLVITGLGTGVIAWINLRAAQEALKLKTEETKQKQAEIMAKQVQMGEEQVALHKTVNSQMDDFKKVLSEAKLAEGNLEGRAGLKAEQAVVAGERLTAKQDAKDAKDAEADPIPVKVVAAVPVPVSVIVAPVAVVETEPKKEPPKK